MNASITVKGYTFTNSKYDEEMEIYLASMPFVQRQGVKGMLDFLRLYSRENVVKFIKSNFSMKPTTNIVVNAIIQYTESQKYNDDLIELEKYIKSKNFFPMEEITRMSRFKEYVTSPLVVDEKFFKDKNIRCEEELELKVSLKLFKDKNRELSNNFINTALYAISNSKAILSEKDYIFDYKHNGMTNTGINLSSVVLDEKINSLNDMTFTQKQFIKAVLVFARKDDRDRADDFIKMQSSKDTGVNAFYDACCNYMTSSEYNNDQHNFNNVYNNGLNDHYEEVINAFEKAGVKNSNGVTIQEIVTRRESRLPCIPCIFEQVIRIHSLSKETEFSPDKFIHSIFNILQYESLSNGEDIKEVVKQVIAPEFTYKGNKVSNNGIVLSDSLLENKILGLRDLSFSQKQLIRAVLVFTDYADVDRINVFIDKYRKSKKENLFKVCINYLDNKEFGVDRYIYDQNYRCASNNEFEKVAELFKCNGVDKEDMEIIDTCKDLKVRFTNQYCIFYEIMLQCKTQKTNINKGKLISGLFENMHKKCKKK